MGKVRLMLNIFFNLRFSSDLSSLKETIWSVFLAFYWLPVLLSLLFLHHRNIQHQHLLRSTILTLVRPMLEDMASTRIHTAIWSRRSYLRTNANPTPRLRAGPRIRNTVNLYSTIIVRGLLRPT